MQKRINSNSDNDLLASANKQVGENKPDQNSLKLPQVKKHFSSNLGLLAGSYPAIVEESEGHSASLTPLGMTPSGANMTPSNNNFNSVATQMNQHNQNDFNVEQDFQMQVQHNQTQRNNKKSQNALPHFHECQKIESADILSNQAESPPGNEILTPLNQPTTADAASQQRQQHDFSASVVGSALKSTAAHQQRPFRSVSPVKTLHLLREIEQLQPRSEQNFFDVVEKEMSSSEESSPMMQRFKMKKMQDEHQNHANQLVLQQQQAQIISNQIAEQQKQKVAQQNAVTANGPQPVSPSQKSSNNDRSVGGVPRNQDKSDHDGATERQNLSPIRPNTKEQTNQAPIPQVNAAPNQEYECSMGEESLQAELRGFDFLHKLAFSHRIDALEVSELNKPPEDATPKVQVKKRGQSYLEQDMKTRKKEKLCQVFALSDQEFKQITQIRRNRQQKSAQNLKQSIRSEIRSERQKVKASSGGFSIKLQIAPSPNNSNNAADGGSVQEQSVATRRSADHAKMVQVKGFQGMKSAFKIPIQACEKIDSSESEERKQQQMQQKAQQQQPMGKQVYVRRMTETLAAQDVQKLVKDQALMKKYPTSVSARHLLPQSSGKAQNNSFSKIAAFKQAKEKRLQEKLGVIQEPLSAQKKPQKGSFSSSSKSSSSSTSSQNFSHGGSHMFYYDYEQFNRKLQIEEHLYSPGADSIQTPSKAPLQTMNNLKMDLLKPGRESRIELQSQRSPSPKQHSIGRECSPDRDGGHTERTHQKGSRTLRFNLQECDYQGNQNQEQIGMHRPQNTWTGTRNRNFQQEQSFDKMLDHQRETFSRNNYEMHSQIQPSHESRSMACRSECLSEHYIKAKKYAALRSSKKSKNQQSQGCTMQSELNNGQGPSPPRTDTNWLYTPTTDTESLRKAINQNQQNRKHNLLKQTTSDLALQKSKFSEPLSAGLHHRLWKQQTSGVDSGNTISTKGNLTQRNQAVAGRLQNFISYQSPVQSKTKQTCNDTIHEAKSQPDDTYFFQQANARIHQTKDSLQVEPSKNVQSNLAKKIHEKTKSMAVPPQKKLSRVLKPDSSSKYMTIKSNKLDKMSKNISNLAGGLSDSSDYDQEQGYVSSYLNMSQSPEQEHKRLRNNSRTKQEANEDNQSMWSRSNTGASALVQKDLFTSGIKSKSILKNKAQSNNFVKESDQTPRLKKEDNDAYEKQVLHTAHDAMNNSSFEAQNCRTSTKKSKKVKEFIMSHTKSGSKSKLGSGNHINLGQVIKDSKENLQAVTEVLALSKLRSSQATVQDPKIITQQQQQPKLMTVQNVDNRSQKELRQTLNKHKQSVINPTMTKVKSENLTTTLGGQMMPNQSHKNKAHLVSNFIQKHYSKDEHYSQQQFQTTKRAQSPQDYDYSRTAFSGGQKRQNNNQSPTYTQNISSSHSPDEELRQQAMKHHYLQSNDYPSSPPFNTLIKMSSNEGTQQQVQSLSPPSKQFVNKQGIIQMFGGQSMGRNGNNGLGNYLSHNDKLMLAHQKQLLMNQQRQHYNFEGQVETDTTAVLDSWIPLGAPKGRQSSTNSTGVAFFGGTSSSGGGGVRQPHYSARGLSPPGMAQTGFSPTGGMAAAQVMGYQGQNYGFDEIADDSSGAVFQGWNKVNRFGGDRTSS